MIGDRPVSPVRLRSTPSSARSHLSSQTYEEIDALTKALDKKVGELFRHIEHIGEVLGEHDRSLRDLRRLSEQHITKEAFEEMRLHMEDTNPKKQLDEEIVYMPQLKRVAGNFQGAIKMVSRDVETLKELMPTLVLRDELAELVEAILADTQAQASAEYEATAAGRLSYKCLLCGRPTNAVTGMITDAEVARLIGEPPQCGPTKTGSDFVLVYGRDGGFRAASAQKAKRAKRPSTSQLPRIPPRSPHPPSA
jgi:hypothetical protein